GSTAIQARTRPVALTIAGSDPSGGAGVQADLKVFNALGVYGYSALTALIAQNSSSVSRVVPASPAMVVAQIDSVAAEHRPDAVKIGALGNAAIVRAVVRAIRDLGLPRPVVDPVIFASAGTRLLDAPGERALRSHLIPIARVVTPNLPEAERLINIRIRSIPDMKKAAEEFVALGAQAAVIKGGHLERSAQSVDFFHDGVYYAELPALRIKGEGAHGTG